MCKGDKTTDNVTPAKTIAERVALLRADTLVLAWAHRGAPAGCMAASLRKHHHPVQEERIVKKKYARMAVRQKGPARTPKTGFMVNAPGPVGTPVDMKKRMLRLTGGWRRAQKLARMLAEAAAEKAAAVETVVGSAVVTVGGTVAADKLEAVAMAVTEVATAKVQAVATAEAAADVMAEEETRYGRENIK